MLGPWRELPRMFVPEAPQCGFPNIGEARVHDMWYALHFAPSELPMAPVTHISVDTRAVCSESRRTRRTMKIL